MGNESIRTDCGPSGCGPQLERWAAGRRRQAARVARMVQDRARLASVSASACGCGVRCECDQRLLNVMRVEIDLSERRDRSRSDAARLQALRAGL